MCVHVYVCVCMCVCMCVCAGYHSTTLLKSGVSTVLSVLHSIMQHLPLSMVQLLLRKLNNAGVVSETQRLSTD